MAFSASAEYQHEGKRTGPSAYQRALLKYNIKPTLPVKHQALLNFQEKVVDDGQGETSAYATEYDAEWLLVVGIGTPPQIMKLDPDTGSSDTWVLSESLKGKIAKGSNVFETKDSSTFKSIPKETWRIDYADESFASGTLGTDVFSIAGIEVKDQAIQLATKASKTFLKSSNEGLIGLAWPSINSVEPKQVPTLIDNMIKQNLLQKPIMGVKLVHQGTGEYTFGYINEADILGDVHYTPVDTRKGFWQLPSSIATIGHKLITRPNKNSAIMDTGTTLVLCDDVFVKAVYAAIPGSKFDEKEGGYILPSNAIIPVIKIAIGDHLFELPKEAILWSKLSPKSEMYYGGIQSRGDSKFDILGDVLLKYMLAIFDYGSGKFGCARRPDVEYRTI